MAAEQGLKFANQFFQAYNDTDWKLLSDLMHEDVKWGHHNRFKGQGRQDLLNFTRKFANMAPGRRFEDPARRAADGDVITIEHDLRATPTEDVAAFGWKANEAISLETCSVLVVKDGKIIEWSDYA